MNKDVKQLSKELTDKILGLLMKKYINEVTWNTYKSELYQLILNYLKSNL